MEKQMLYRDLARYYDLLYSWKDYEEEAKELKKLIKKYKASDGKELLDVACGTGKHLKYLKGSFSCTGIDKNKEMLRVAEKGARGVSFKEADMADFNLKKKFDVITCLFSSIGYVKTYPRLKKTIRNFARHLKKGGVVIIEPWLEKSVFKLGAPYLTTHDGKDIKIARVNVSLARDSVSVLDMHYLIAEKDKGVKHFVDRHELGLFDTRKILQFLEEAGIKATSLDKSLTEDRGVIVGVKQ